MRNSSQYFSCILYKTGYPSWLRIFVWKCEICRFMWGVWNRFYRSFKVTKLHLLSILVFKYLIILLTHFVSLRSNFPLLDLIPKSIHSLFFLSTSIIVFTFWFMSPTSYLNTFLQPFINISCRFLPSVIPILIALSWIFCHISSHNYITTIILSQFLDYNYFTICIYFFAYTCAFATDHLDCL